MVFSMFYSGFVDEAGRSLDEQIKATKILGWNNIDMRFVGDKNLTDISDEDFEKAYEVLTEEKITVPCFGSSIAHSGKDPRDEAQVEYSTNALKRAIVRMKRLGTKMIRGMAFGAPDDMTDDGLDKLIVKRLTPMVRLCEDAGVMYVCENCGGYSGKSYETIVRLVETIDSPLMKIVYDMGNTVESYNQTGKKPYKRQNAWECYQAVKGHIEYVHIKDTRIDENGNRVRTFPGEGDADVKIIVEDLLKNGYDNGFSIEPHMKNGFDGYIEYGKRFEALANSVLEMLNRKS